MRERKPGSAARIDGIIKTVLKKIDSPSKKKGEAIEKIWGEIAGAGASGHSKPVSLRKKKLTVHVDDSGWLYELSLRKKELLHKLQSVLGDDVVTELRLRIGEGE